MPAGAGREPLDLTLRLRHAAVDLHAVAAAIARGSRAPMTRREFAARFGAAAADIEAVVAWARRAGVAVVQVDRTRRSVHVRAAAGRLARIFRVARVRYRRDGEVWDGYDGTISVPRALAASVTGVTGFDRQPGHAARPLAATGSPARSVSFTPQGIARHYGFPRRADGSGQTIGVIALGGAVLRSDIAAFFEEMRLPRPQVTVVGVAGRAGGHAPSGEVTGDVQTAGGLAPGARIVVYMAPNTERGFLEAVSHAVHDRRRAPSVISISWGRNEMHWVRRTLRHFDDVLAEAAALGISVCCSSGDTGALADRFDRRPRVCFPASSRYVIACGGTSLARRHGLPVRERPWANRLGASGGGTSAVFPRPAWQQGVATGGVARRRRVPDVAANADPDSGYRVCFEGRWVVGAGTSASAPVWAGLLARVNQMRGTPAGLVTPLLYRRYRALVAGGAIRPIADRPGAGAPARWSVHTGLGVPGGARLASALARPV